MRDRESEDRRRSAEAITEIASRLGQAYELLFTRRYECGGQAHRIATFQHKATGIELNLLPGGTFQMGGTRYADEGPVHPVKIARPFLIGRFPVLVREWDKGQQGAANGGHPAVRMTWTQARDWLRNAGDGLRLASEAEWEYACRAGTTTEYFWGEAMNEAYCWYDVNSGGRDHDVKDHENKPNAFGLVDMSGNAWEWCQDVWFDDASDGPNDAPARLVEPSSERVHRGGGWYDSAERARSAARDRLDPALHGDFLGFRCARDS